MLASPSLELWTKRSRSVPVDSEMELLTPHQALPGPITTGWRTSDSDLSLKLCLEGGGLRGKGRPCVHVCRCSLQAGTWLLRDHPNPSWSNSHGWQLAERKMMALTLWWLHQSFILNPHVQNGSRGDGPEGPSPTAHHGPSPCFFRNRAGRCQTLCRRPGPRLGVGFLVSPHEWVKAHSRLRSLADLHHGGD